MSVTINLSELEAEAIEVNRRYNNYEALRLQHRAKAVKLLNETEDPEEVVGVARILLMTRGGE